MTTIGHLWFPTIVISVSVGFVSILIGGLFVDQVTEWQVVVIISLISLNFVAALAPFMYEWKFGRLDPFSPSVLTAVLFLLMYVLKPIYIISSGELGVGVQYRHALHQDEIGYLIRALLLSFSGVMLYDAGYYMATRHRMLKVEVKTVPIRIYVLIPITLICVALSISTVYFFFRITGSWSELLEFTAIRKVFTEGYGRMFLLGTLSNTCLLIITARLFSLKDKGLIRLWFFPWLGLLCLTQLVWLLSGGRSLFLFNLLGIIIIYHFIRRHLSFKTVFFVGVIFLMLSLSYSAFLREVFYSYNKGTSGAGIFLEKTRDLPKAILGGPDVVQIDALMRLVEAVPKELNWQYGTTLVALLLYPIPREFLPDKPVGGMATFTRDLYPEFYWPRKTELSVSYIGDLYLNFGLLGSWVGMGLIGLMVGLLYRKVSSTTSGFWVIIYAITLVRLVSLFRGDVYNAGVNYLLESVPLLIFGVLTLSPRVSAPSASETVARRVLTPGWLVCIKRR